MNDIMNQPLLSIVVPVYGTEQYLRKCIDSILFQSYRNLEVIIVNDASKGKCKEIVEEYQKVDHRVKYVVHEENKGLFRARVTGAEYACGEYIAFADSDDYLSLDFYRPMIQKAEKDQLEIVANTTILREADGSFHQYTLHK
ncbi:MAG: glycosyltransferase family 2 protein, partial [Lachnospiraceae bacterium]|nr:glycosyltransferase family 2 protein [Lachnospiraceae bacterium]